MEKNKKPRLSLIYRIAAIFILAFAVAVSLVYMMGKKFLLADTIDEKSEVAKSALIGAIELIWSRDQQLSIFEDEEAAERAHQSFRDICRETGLRYLYLYNVDEQGIIHYTVCAARDDEDDKRINELYGFGSTRERKLYTAEEKALTGDTDCHLEIVSNSFGYVCCWVTPLVNKEGEVKGLLGADYDMSGIAQKAHRTLIIFAITAFLAFVFTFVISVILIRLGATKPLKDLARRMTLFTREKKAYPGSRKSLFQDEITDLELSFNSMATEIERYINDIEDLTRQRVQTQTQMEVARRIQYGVVPEKTQVSSTSFDIYGFSKPAKEVGGDFYDIIKMPDEKICLIEGDVSGKGISAALFMMMVRSAIREKIRSGMDPAEALNQVNDDVCQSNPESMFATVFAGVFDCRSGVLTYANAGHNPPVIVGGGIRELEVEPGIALGFFEDAGIVSDTVRLGNGEGILIYTDGITESLNKDDEQFGLSGIERALGKEDVNASSGNSGNEEKVHPARLMAETVTGAVGEFSQGLEQFDDITCLTFVNLGSGEGEIALLPKQQEFDKVKELLLGRIKDLDKAKRAVLCCEEMFTNIVKYSGADEITFRYREGEGCIEAEFIDNGTAFDPVSSERIEKEFEELDSGGMGIALAKENCREMTYDRTGEKNILHLVLDA